MANTMPMPMSPIMDNPAYLTAGTLAFGGIFKILLCWWQYGCPELSPQSDLRVMSGMRLQDWKKHKNAILEAINAIMPRMQEYYVQALKKAKARSHIGRLGGKASAAKRQRTGQQAVQKKGFFSDQYATSCTTINPVSPPSRKFHDGFSDPFARQRAIAAQKNKKGTADHFFTDG